MPVLNQIRKIRRMSAAELRHRIGMSLMKRRERWRWKHHPRNDELAISDPSVLLSDCQTIIPGVCDQNRTRLREQFPQFEHKISSESNRLASTILEGHWQMLGHTFDLRETIDWHKDPRSDFHWDREFYADVRYADIPGNVDVKYAWELGRHQFVVELARGWLFDGNDDFANRARDILLSWIAENPRHEGIHWTSGLEVAMRAISWIWTLATLSNWSGWRETDLKTIGGSLVEHAEFLQNHFSFYYSPYNHLIGEAAALYLIGQALKGQSESAMWRLRGRDVLLKHGPQQFYSDGFCVEQASGYHYYTLGFLLMAIAVAQQADEPLKELEQVAHKAALAGAAFRRPDGRWPAIGDVDSARSIPVHHDEFLQFDSLCSLAAVLFDDPKLKTAENDSGTELYWLLGSDGVERWSRLECMQNIVSTNSKVILEESGYMIASGSESWLLFDAGPIAAGLFPDATPSTAHGHADTLQVLYFAGGRPLLHDCGMPFYNGGDDWVRHFRSPEAHNTVSIEGCKYVNSVGRLAWSHEVTHPTLTTESGEDVWLAHGRVEWPSVVLERHLLCLPETGLWIADYIFSKEEREAHWFWQVPSSERPQIETTSNGKITIPFDQCIFEITSSAGHFDVCHQTPVSTRPEGWRCTGYGTRTAASRLVVRRVVAGETVVLTAIKQPTANVEVQIETAKGDIVETGVNQCASQLYQSGSLRWTVRSTQGRYERFQAIEQATIIHDEIAR